jgi:hypothetical protein
MLKKNVGAFKFGRARQPGVSGHDQRFVFVLVANRRMTDATLQHIAPMAKRALDVSCGDGTYTHYIKGEILLLEPTASKDLPLDAPRRFRSKL